jgi:hypothetical protein
MVSYRSPSILANEMGASDIMSVLSDASPVVPNLLHTLFSGRLCEIKPKMSSYAHYYLWEAERRQAREPLLRLLPHLRLKRRHAERALELLDLIEQQNVGRFTSTPLDAEQEAAWAEHTRSYRRPVISEMCLA